MKVSMFIFLLSSIILHYSCGGRKSKDVSGSTEEWQRLVLENQAENYERWMQKHLDEHHFVHTKECDSTLFSGLLSIAYPDNIDVTVARDYNDVWYRRPGHDCGPDFGNSRATISRDMMLGAYWGMWVRKDLDSMIRLMDKLKGNLYYMPGKGDIGTMLMNPAMMNTLAQMIRALGGPSYETELLFPAVFTPNKDYINHLTMWHIYLRGEVIGSISTLNYRVIKSIAEGNLHNPLYQAIYHRYTDGDMSTVIDLLLDVKLWPRDHLPTSENYCGIWVIQRDMGKDWAPCPEKKPGLEHSGAEWLLIYKIFIEEK